MLHQHNRDPRAVTTSRPARSKTGSLFTLALALALAAITLTSQSVGAQGIIDLETLDGTDGFSLVSSTYIDYYGQSASAAGDFNGDGIDDVIFGAEEGGILIFGKSSGFPASIDIANLGVSDGLRFVYPPNGAAGYGSCGVGDFNGDGFDDIAIGAFTAQSSAGVSVAGRTFLVYGKSTFTTSTVRLDNLNGTDGFILDGTLNTEQTGCCLSGGDINQDGYDDLIIGAQRAGFIGVSLGACYVIFGSAATFPAVFTLDNLNGANGFRIDGPLPNSYNGNWFGCSCSVAGDINGDGFPDIIVGAYETDYNATTWAGYAAVIFGKASGFPAIFSASGLDGTNGFSVHGTEEHGRVGYSVSGAGDVNSDGLDDVIIGSYYTGEHGDAYVLFGKNDWSTSASLTVDELNGTNGFMLDGTGVGNYVGGRVAGAGDINDDGFDDVLVGPITIDSANPKSTGYLVFGKTDWSANASVALSSINGTNGYRLEPVSSNGMTGTQVSAAGDVNNDGIDDFVISGLGFGDNPGGAYVVFGKSQSAIRSWSQY